MQVERTIRASICHERVHLFHIVLRDCNNADRYEKYGRILLVNSNVYLFAGSVRRPEQRLTNGARLHGQICGTLAAHTPSARLQLQ
jgi:hypothetical protein